MDWDEMQGGSDSDDSFNEAFESDDLDEDTLMVEGDEVELKEDSEVIGTEQVRKQLSELVASVASFLNVDEDLASGLLRCFKWDRERAAADYFADPEALLRKLGLHNFQHEPPAPELNQEGTTSCPICDDDEIPAPDAKALGCGHYFCTGCWSDYLVDQITKGKDAIMARCPMHKCECRIPDSFIREVVGEKSEAWERFQSFLVKAFVDDHHGMRWCPAPRCERILRAAAHLTTIKCACGNSMCWRCGQESHQPATCDMLAKWLLKCSDESETAKWIIANTKRCPKCNVRIEKDRGCNHMTCRSCAHEFCWVCNGPWVDHGNHTGGFYKCNKYDPRSAAAGGDGRATAKEELDRYLFYYQRYHNHDQSRKFAEKLRLGTEKRMQEMRDQAGHAASWMDVQFLQAATEQVLKCRNVLKYTYVFAYFLESGPEKTLFEYLQQELERTTEQLSELSEQPLEKLSRPEVANCTRVTDQFLQNLLEGTADGLIQVPGEA